MVDLKQALADAWYRVRSRVETVGDLAFNHEFTLQFHLAWEVARVYGYSDQLNVRFEVPCGRDANGETIRLDLLLWIDPSEKVAVELKAPVKSNGKNSAMTQFRMRFYRDVDRLRHLVEHNVDGIVLGCFVAVVNEPGYVRERNQKVNAAYRTYHGTCLRADAIIPAQPGSNGCEFPLRMPAHEILWSWHCEQVGSEIRLAANMRHYWLDPIFVQRGAVNASDEYDSPMPRHWLRRRLQPDDPEYADALRQFGAQMQADDEVWFYDEPAPPGVNAGELGYALVRAGKPISWFATAIH